MGNENSLINKKVEEILPLLKGLTFEQIKEILYNLKMKASTSAVVN